MFKKNIFLIIVLGLLFINITLASAQQSAIIPEASGNRTVGCSAPNGSGVSDATYCGNYELNDFVVLVINAARWVMGIIGILSLIMFIYGGITFLISAGSSETVSRATKIITAAVIGLIIVFSSFLIIKFVLGTMGLEWDGSMKLKATTTPSNISTNQP